MSIYGVVYVVKNKTNNKLYIGQTIEKKPISRWKYGHVKRALTEQNRPLSNAIRKYGEDNFDFEVLYCAFDAVALNSAEEILVREFNTIVPNGYNLRHGGGSTGKHSQITLDKMSLSQIRSFLNPVRRENMVKAAIRRQASPEVQEAQKLARLRPGHKELHSFATAQALARPEVKERHCTGAKRVGNDPAEKTRRRERSLRPESIAVHIPAMQQAVTGGRWINNGVVVRRLRKGELLPAEWVYGKFNFTPSQCEAVSKSLIGKSKSVAHRQAVSRALKGRFGKEAADTRWITDGVTRRRLKADQPLPNGWRYGRG